MEAEPDPWFNWKVKGKEDKEEEESTVFWYLVFSLYQEKGWKQLEGWEEYGMNLEPCFLLLNIREYASYKSFYCMLLLFSFGMIYAVHRVWSVLPWPGSDRMTLKLYQPYAYDFKGKNN